MRDYERLDVYQFGRHLLETGDLDPVYILLTDETTGMSADQRLRWLVAYWCLYSVGPASHISEFEGRHFWNRLGVAAANELPTPLDTRWPRGHERRHFRGKAAINAVAKLSEMYENRPEQLVEELVVRYSSNAPLPFRTVSERTQELPLFGPWMAFKVADMAERVLGVPVDFDEAAVFMFRDPAKAATLLWREHNPKLATAVDEGRARVKQAQINHGVSQHLIHHFRDHLAPPGRDRLIGLQEVETILCKWKSHMNGHYPLWNDTREIVQTLRAWAPHSDTADNFLAVAEWIEEDKQNGK